MKVLVVNGRKVNSFALALESAVFFSGPKENVLLVDLDVFGLPLSSRKRVQKKISRAYSLEKGANFFSALKNLVKAARVAAAWFDTSSKSENPWESLALNGKLPLGRLVQSLIARSMGTSNFKLTDCAKAQVYDIAFKAVFSYFQIATEIEKSTQEFDLGVAHGGRDAYSAGAICAFRQFGIKTKLVESGGIPMRWSLFDTSPHYSPDFWSRLEKSHSKKFSESQVTDWWTERLAGSDHFRTEEWGHTRDKGLIPHNLPKEYISFFTTSDFEIPVFQDFDVFPGEFSNQTQAFFELYRICEINKIHVVVRRHPNSIDHLKVDREKPIWRDIQNLPGVTYLGPHERVDSISLAQGSRTVFTFKSSVGIEAIWLGVPAFALGPARWAWSGELRAWDLESLESAVLKPKTANRDHAVRWANMMLEMDYPNSQFEEIHGNVTIFNSVTVRNSSVSTSIDRFVVAFLRRFTQIAGMH
jgi:hypothetical protein